jgi:hypothetical protein
MKIKQRLELDFSCLMYTGITTDKICKFLKLPNMYSRIGYMYVCYSGEPDQATSFNLKLLYISNIEV